MTNRWRAGQVCLALLGCLFLIGCATAPASPTSDDTALLYSPQNVAARDRLVIFVPGALTSVQMFSPADGWAVSGFADVYYRFPGVDGRALTAPLNLDEAADQIADFANAHPAKDVALVGYSSGAPIAMMAASRITGNRIVPVAAISPAVERAGGVPTLARGAADVARAATRAGTADPTQVWIEYWHILLYGRSATPDPAFRERVIQFARTQRGDRGLGPPDTRLARAHARQIRYWDIPDDLDLSHVRLRVYVGLEDPVFSTAQTLKFAQQLGAARIYGYPDEGHLLYLTQPDVFDTARQFAVGVLESR